MDNGNSTSDTELRQFAWDFCKHITTLSTGAIAVIVGFREKWAVSNGTIWLIPVALAAFAITILCALFTMNDFFAEKQRGYGTISFNVAGIGFVAGVFVVLLFATLNLKTSPLPKPQAQYRTSGPGVAATTYCLNRISSRSLSLASHILSKPY